MLSGYTWDLIMCLNDMGFVFGQVLTCYLSFLCARLLDLRNETRAARVIQSAWRRYKLHKVMRINQVIYTWPDTFTLYQLIFSCFPTKFLYEQLRNQAARKIQTLVRSFLEEKRLNRRNMAALVIQAAWRGRSAREELKRVREAKRSAMRETAAILIQVSY